MRPLADWSADILLRRWALVNTQADKNRHAEASAPLGMKIPRVERRLETENNSPFGHRPFSGQCPRLDFRFEISDLRFQISELWASAIFRAMSALRQRISPTRFSGFEPLNLKHRK
jgi:hypothetical protein